MLASRQYIFTLGNFCLTSAEFRTESTNCSARNPLIVRAEFSKCPRGIRWLSMRTYADSRAAICGLSTWSSAEKVKFSVSCTVATGRLAIVHVHTYANTFLKGQCQGFTSCGTGIPTKRIQGKKVKWGQGTWHFLKSAVRRMWRRKKRFPFRQSQWEHKRCSWRYTSKDQWRHGSIRKSKVSILCVTVNKCDDLEWWWVHWTFKTTLLSLKVCNSFAWSSQQLRSNSFKIRSNYAQVCDSFVKVREVETFQ